MLTAAFLLSAAACQGNASMNTGSVNKETSATENPVLEDSRYVMANAESVRIDNQAVDALAEKWAEKEFSLPRWDFFVDMKLPLEDRFDHFLLADTINFFYQDPETGKTYSTILEHDKSEHYAADGMFASLCRAEVEKIPVLEGEFLEKLTAEKFQKIFRPENPMPMIKERVTLLNATGKVLNGKYGGKFRNILKNTGKSVKVFDFAEFLAKEFPEAYSDTAYYKGRKIKFHKKAHLAAAQAWENLVGTGFFEITDPENFVVFADYELPKVLRKEGILIYSTELAEKVDAGEVIDAGSGEEIEIRAGTVLAADMLKEKINFYRLKNGKPPVNNLHIDKELWFAGTSIEGVNHHFTRTTAY